MSKDYFLIMNVKCVLNKKIKVQKLLRTCFKKKLLYSAS